MTALPAAVGDTLNMLGSADYVADRSLATAVGRAVILGCASKSDPDRNKIPLPMGEGERETLAGGNPRRVFPDPRYLIASPQPRHPGFRFQP